MDNKLAIVIVVIFTLVVDHRVAADFFFQRRLPKLHELGNTGFKCVPGRTWITVEQKLQKTGELDSSEEEVLSRRGHMNHPPSKDESCKICVCSIEGKDQYCSRRPAMNVNECLRMSKLMEDFQKNVPYDHDRTLAYRIRRVGSDVESPHCVPFVSEYSDCTEENQCSGCIRCTCTASADWSCGRVVECPANDYAPVDDNALDNALTVLYSELKNKEASSLKAQAQAKPKEDLILGYLIAVP